MAGVLLSDSVRGGLEAFGTCINLPCPLLNRCCSVSGSEVFDTGHCDAMGLEPEAFPLLPYIIFIY